MKRKVERGSDIAQNIIVEWNREKYYKRLAERQKKREKDKQEQEK